MEKKEALAKEQLEIADIVTPGSFTLKIICVLESKILLFSGSSHLRGALLYHIYSVMSTQIEKLKETNYDIPPELNSQIKVYSTI